MLEELWDIDRVIGCIVRTRNQVRQGFTNEKFGLKLDYVVDDTLIENTFIGTFNDIVPSPPWMDSYNPSVS